VQEQVTFSINGADVKAPKSAYVLDVALSYGICIPNLCHVPTLTPIGGCRLCIVELEERGRTKVTASCTLEAREGIIIRTHTERIVKARRNIAVMLVTEAPNSRAIQDIAVKCGVKEGRYPFRGKDCVLCGRCVRVCSELWRSNSLGFIGRGQDRHVALPFNKRPDYCKNCYNCVSICPMTITPCNGPMKKGEERLCGKCESQLSMSKGIEESCVDCILGEGFDCASKPGL